MKASELHHALLAAVDDGFADRAADLYAPDAEVEIVFAPDVDREVHGADSIRARFAEARGSGLTVRVHDVRWLGSSEPHVSVAEYDYTWSVAGRPEFSTHNLQVVEERDGLIARTRDYHDHVRIAQGLRGPEEVADAAHAVERMQTAFNTRDFDAVDSVFHPYFVSHPLDGAGRDVVRERWRAMVSDDPTITVRPVALVSDAQIAAVRSVAGGDRTPDIELLEFVRTEGGQIRELWGAISRDGRTTEPA